MNKSKTFTMPISTNDVLTGLNEDIILLGEIKHGNSDLIKILHLLNIAGPFKSVSPWELETIQGKRLIHAGGYAALPFGENYPPLLTFVKNYLTINHFMGLPQQAISVWRSALQTNLIQLLASLAPTHADSQIFFSNSGAEAIETALKFAKASRPKGRYIINFNHGYHGKTYGALSVTPNIKYQALFKPLIPDVITLLFNDANLVESTIRRLGADNIIAILLEPIQGEGGVIIPSEHFLPEIEVLRKKYDILVIADEIQTGLGRSGFWFASIEWGKLIPDIITLAKPLGGGLIPIGATIARKTIYKKMLGGLDAKRHSSTFSGGSLAMAIGLKSLEILYSENLVERAKELGKIGIQKLQEIQKNYPTILKEVRGFGMLMALQFYPGRLLKSFTFSDKVEELAGILGYLRLFDNGIYANFSLNANSTIRLTPALNIPNELFIQIFEKISDSMEKNTKKTQEARLKKLFDLIKLMRSSKGEDWTKSYENKESA